MKILEELYYGNIAEGDRRCSDEEKMLRKNENAIYEAIKDKLLEEDKHLMDDYVEAWIDREDVALANTYINGFKTGLLMGIECMDIKFDGN